MVTTRKRLRSNEIALIGIVLLALGIAVLAGAPRLGARVALSSALWAGALGTFVAARRAGVGAGSLAQARNRFGSRRAAKLHPRNRSLVNLVGSVGQPQRS